MGGQTKTLKYDWLGTGAFKSFAKFVNHVSRRVSTVDCQPSGTGWFDDTGLHLDGVGGGIQLSRFTLGVASISDNKITVSAGKIVRGKVAYDVAETEVTVTGGDTTNPHYIYAQLSGTSATVPTTATATFPVSDDAVFRQCLYAVTLTGSSASVYRIHHLGDIVIWGAFAQ